MARPRKIDPASISPFHARLNGLKLQGESDGAFALRLGLSQGGLSRIFNGGKPDFDTLISIANKGGVSVHWLITGETPSVDLADDDVILLRHLDVRPSAGPGRIAAPDETEPVRLPREILRRLSLSPENARVMRASGSSMEPTIFDGDLLLVDAAQRRAVDNQIFVFSIGDDLFVKRLRMEPGRGWIIVSDNPNVQPVELPKGEYVEIFGRVRWTERKL